jgi:hypothetical protein
MWSFSGEESSATPESQSRGAERFERRRTSNQSCSRRPGNVELPLLHHLPPSPCFLRKNSSIFIEGYQFMGSYRGLSQRACFSLTFTSSDENLLSLLKHIHQLSVLDHRSKRFLLEAQHAYTNTQREAQEYTRMDRTVWGFNEDR